MALPRAGFSRLEVAKQALGGIPLGLGMVVKINLLNFQCNCTLEFKRPGFKSLINSVLSQVIS